MAACASESPDGEPDPADPAAADTAAAAAETRIVLAPGPLRIDPSDDADGVADAAAGTALRVVGDTTIAGARWVRLATWDDRRGWMPVSAVLEPGLWAHYLEALGGVPVTATRPAYPVEDGRWVAEKPFPSPDFDPPAAVRLAADGWVATRVARRDTVTVGCTGERLSAALLGTGVVGAIPEDGSFLSRGTLAVPVESDPSATPLAIGPLEPGPAWTEAVAGAASAALEDGPAPGTWRDPDAPPPPAGGEPVIEWRSAGPDAAWAVASWNPYGGADARVMPGRWAAAFVAVREGEGWTVRTAIPLQWTTAGGERAPWRLLAAIATVPGRPTLLAVEALEHEGARIDLYLADDAGYRRYHRGFYWGC